MINNQNTGRRQMLHKRLKREGARATQARSIAFFWEYGGFLESSELAQPKEFHFFFRDLVHSGKYPLIAASQLWTCGCGQITNVFRSAPQKQIRPHPVIPFRFVPFVLRSKNFTKPSYLDSFRVWICNQKIWGLLPVCLLFFSYLSTLTVYKIKRTFFW